MSPRDAPRYLPPVPGLLRASILTLALGLGLAAGCFKEDFLLGAYCIRDSDCGADQCCSGDRCRPDIDGHCDRGPGADTHFDWAYTVCDSDADCLAHGMPRCVVLDGAPAGFCADLCFGIPRNCETREDALDRVCLTVDTQQLCALRCCSSACGPDPCPGQTDCPGPCPDDMTCLADVCVPKAAP